MDTIGDVRDVSSEVAVWLPDDDNPDADKPARVVMLDLTIPPPTAEELERAAEEAEYHAQGVDDPNLSRHLLAEAAMLRRKAAVYVAAPMAPRTLACVRPSTRPVARGRAPRPRPVARGRARAPSRNADDPSEPPPLALTPVERRGLRMLIDSARRRQVARFVVWRTCCRCLREQEPAEFSNGSTYCKSCEAERIADRRRKAAA
jgi:hypothetical protein